MSEAVKSDLCGNQQAMSKKKSAPPSAMNRRMKGGAITKAIESTRSSEIAIRQKYIGVTIEVDVLAARGSYL
jgi:hypothetical protein